MSLRFIPGTKNMYTQCVVEGYQFITKFRGNRNDLRPLFETKISLAFFFQKNNGTLLATIFHKKQEHRDFHFFPKKT
jgi:hypothetical protein